MSSANYKTKMLFPESQFANAVFLSLDWASFVCQSCTIRELMYLLKLHNFSRVSFKREELRIHPGNDCFSFDINGIQFCVNRTLVACYGLDVESNDIFDYRFPTVRVNCTGNGLRFLRSVFDEEHIWLDQWLLYFFLLPDAPQGHFTRLDFALDFVNDFRNILSNILTHLRLGGTKNGVPSAGKFTAGTRPYQTKLWEDPGSGGCTVYIGSNASDQMLRVYNKFAESHDYFSIPYKDPVSGEEVFCRWKDGRAPDFPDIPAEDIKSWIRFEMVLRNKKAMEFTPASADDPCVFDHPSFFAKIIHTKFQPVRDSLYVDWWKNFWAPIEDDYVINLNANFVQCRESSATRIVNSMVTMFGTNSLICEVLCGSDFMRRYYQRLLLYIQLSTLGDENKAWIKLKQVLTSDGIMVEDLNLYYDQQLRAWQFPDVPLLNKVDCINQYQRQFGSRFGWSWDPSEEVSE